MLEKESIKKQNILKRALFYFQMFLFFKFDKFFWNKINIDIKTGVITLRTKGAGDSVGVGDREYNGGTGTGRREALRRGGLGSVSDAGFSGANLWVGVSDAGWLCALCV